MNDNLTLSLSIEKMNVIMAALGRMPFEQVFQLIGEINGQLQPQVDKAPSTPVAPAVPSAN